MPLTEISARKGKTENPREGNINPLGLFKMNEQELIIIVSFAGRYEVISDGDGKFVCIPVSVGSVLNTPESHEECIAFFRNDSD